jgi:hypothetical protein
MKIALLLISLAFLSLPNRAQETPTEKDFAGKIKTFSLEKFSMGEDASSGFDYLIYKNKTQIVKIRSVWSSSANDEPRVDDFYFQNGRLILYVKLSVDNKQLKNVVKGSNIPLRAVEKLTLKDSRLTEWTENGKTVSAADPRWKEREKSVLEHARGELENYRMYQEEK